MMKLNSDYNQLSKKFKLTWTWNYLCRLFSSNFLNPIIEHEIQPDTATNQARLVVVENLNTFYSFLVLYLFKIPTDPF